MIGTSLSPGRNENAAPPVSTNFAGIRGGHLFVDHEIVSLYKTVVAVPDGAGVEIELESSPDNGETDEI